MDENEIAWEEAMLAMRRLKESFELALASDELEDEIREQIGDGISRLNTACCISGAGT